jgi:hypothetical protein
MTPKLKAKQLYELIRYHVSTLKGTEPLINEVAKRCALIAVDEIITQIEPSISMDVISARIKYWQDVKQEIENL